MNCKQSFSSKIPDINPTFHRVGGIFGVKGKLYINKLGLGGFNVCFFGFSTKNHAESHENWITESFLNPKRTKSNENSCFGHVQTCPLAVQKSRTCPVAVQEDKALSAGQASLFFVSRNYIFLLFISKISILLQNESFC